MQSSNDEDQDWDEPTHATITEQQISDLVDEFYNRVWKHPRLGPIFSSRLDGKRDQHLVRMKKFWASILLRTGEYHGRPVPKHKALSEVVPKDFAIWLTLFRTTANEVLEVGLADHVTEKAERIAQSLWLAMFAGIGDTPPGWLRGPEYISQYEDLNARD